MFKQILIGFFCLILSGLSFAAPQLINYQGRLTDESGNPLTGSYNLSFGIYTVSTGGDPVWSETQTGVTVTDGLFNVLLGGVSPIDNLPDGPDCWLEVAVGGTAISPRIQMASVPYALKADDADKLDGKSSAAFEHVVAETSAASPVTIYDTDWVDMPDMTLTVTTGDCHLLINFVAPSINTVDGNTGWFQLLLDGTQIAKGYTHAYQGYIYSSMVMMRMPSVSAGAHTVKVQWRSSSSSYLLQTQGTRTLTAVEFK